ncbi:hypothetical protein Taro_036337 [Colocasia esculenta]|uniref:Uncharacterized protein n=1 Tax=Colocasia esculenta TaxID=4460 RepID=A0A843W1B5_COLES|nr:hypothetical protein [Colocasia esculenta]
MLLVVSASVSSRFRSPVLGCQSMVAPACVASRPRGVSKVRGGSTCGPSTLWRSEVAVLMCSEVLACSCMPWLADGPLEGPCVPCACWACRGLQASGSAWFLLCSPCLFTRCLALEGLSRSEVVFVAWDPHPWEPVEGVLRATSVLELATELADSRAEGKMRLDSAAESFVELSCLGRDTEVVEAVLIPGSFPIFRVPAALDAEGLVIPTEPCSQGSPPYFLQLGARRRGSSVSDGLRRRLWRRVLTFPSVIRCPSLHGGYSLAVPSFRRHRWFGLVGPCFWWFSLRCPLGSVVLFLGASPRWHRRVWLPDLAVCPRSGVVLLVGPRPCGGLRWPCLWWDVVLTWFLSGLRETPTSIDVLRLVFVLCLTPLIRQVDVLRFDVLESFVVGRPSFRRLVIIPRFLPSENPSASVSSRMVFPPCPAETRTSPLESGRPDGHTSEPAEEIPALKVTLGSYLPKKPSSHTSGSCRQADIIADTRCETDDETFQWMKNYPNLDFPEAMVDKGKLSTAQEISKGKNASLAEEVSQRFLSHGGKKSTTQPQKWPRMERADANVVAPPIDTLEQQWLLKT